MSDETHGSNGKAAQEMRDQDRQFLREQFQALNSKVDDLANRMIRLEEAEKHRSRSEQNRAKVVWGAIGTAIASGGAAVWQWIASR